MRLHFVFWSTKIEIASVYKNHHQTSSEFSQNVNPKTHFKTIKIHALEVLGQIYNITPCS